MSVALLYNDKYECVLLENSKARVKRTSNIRFLSLMSINLNGLILYYFEKATSASAVTVKV